jgi:hypothetical protein
VDLGVRINEAQMWLEMKVVRRYETVFAQRSSRTAAGPKDEGKRFDMIQYCESVVSFKELSNGWNRIPC